MFVRSKLIPIVAWLVICTGLICADGLLPDASAQDLSFEMPNVQELRKAIDARDWIKVQALLPGVEACTKNRRNAEFLMQALNNHKGSLSDSMWIIDLLLARGANVNAQDSQGNSILMAAVYWRSVKLVKTLLKKGAHIQVKNRNGETVLHVAAEMGHSPDVVEVVKLLVQAHARVDERDHEGRTALMLAAETEEEAMVKYLLAQHANVNARDKDGMTVLMYSLNSYPDALTASDQAREAAIVQELLRRGAKVNSKMYDGRTALMRAVYGGNEATVRLLLRHGAKINARDWNGSTALDYCQFADIADPKMEALLRAHGGRHGTGKL